MRVTDDQARAAMEAYYAAFRFGKQDGIYYSEEERLEAMRAALEAALSHAAGQDGEQCRAASGEDAYVIEQMGRLLAEIAVIVNGPEPPMTRWSYHDLPEKVRALSRGVPEGNQAAVDSVIRQYCRTCGGCGGLGDEVKFALYQLEQMAQGGPLAFDAAIIRAAANLLRALAKKAAEA